MQINCFYILVFGVNVIVCLPQWNEHKSSLSVNAEKGNKNTENERSFTDNNLKDKEESTTVEDFNEKVGKEEVLNMNEGMYTNQRLIPIYYPPYYGQTDHVALRRWLPAPPGYIIVPRASGQISRPIYDVPFEKDVREPEVAAVSHINGSTIKNPSINPVETVYVVPPKIAFTPKLVEPIISTPYLSPIPLDPDGYNSQETDVPTRPLNYPPQFVQPRYFGINGPRPYYRHPVHPLPRYTSVNVYPQPFEHGINVYREPSLPKTLNEKLTGLQEQGSDNPNQNSQSDNNFESPNIDTTKISGFITPDAINDFNHFDYGHHIYFTPNERRSRPYRNPESKQTPENTEKLSDDSSFIHNDNNATQEIDVNEQNHQNDLSQKSKVDSSFEISYAKSIKKSLSEKTDISRNNNQIHPPPIDNQDFANGSKIEAITEHEDKMQKFYDVNNTKQHEKLDTSVNSSSQEPVFNNSGEQNESQIESSDIENTTIVVVGNAKSKHQSLYSNENILKDTAETPSKEINIKINDDDDKTTGADDNEKYLNIQTTAQLQPSYDINKGYENDDQETDTVQIEAPLGDDDKSIFNDDSRSMAGINTATKKFYTQKTTEENLLIDKHVFDSKQITENNYDSGVNNSGVENSIKDTTQKNDSKYTYEIQLTQLENEPESPENLRYKKFSKYNHKEDEQSNTETDKQDSIKYKFPLSEISSDNSNNREGGENTDHRKPQIEDNRYDKQYFKRINDTILNSETVNITHIEPKTNDKDKDFFSDTDLENSEYKITELERLTKHNDQVSKQEQSEIDSYTKNIREAIDNKHLKEDTAASETTTNAEQYIFAPSKSDTDSIEGNDDDGVIDSDVNNDNFYETSSASQTTTEESITSKLGFTTTCIRHPVDISMNDGNAKNTAEPIRLEFYRKLFEEYYKNHNAVPLTITQKDIRSFVYKNGTVVEMITETVWNDEKPVEINTSMIIKQLRKKLSQRNQE